MKLHLKACIYRKRHIVCVWEREIGSERAATEMEREKDENMYIKYVHKICTYAGGRSPYTSQKKILAWGLVN